MSEADVNNTQEIHVNINNSNYFEPKYFLIFVLVLFCIYFLFKNYNNQRETIKDRIWRKFAFSYQEMMNTFDPSEKELLKHTFHNTIFNTKSAMTTSETKKSSKKNSSVSFNLDKNVTHEFQS